MRPRVATVNVDQARAAVGEIVRLTDHRTCRLLSVGPDGIAIIVLPGNRRQRERVENPR